MNITKIITVGVVVMTMGVFALDNVEVTNVTARQRYPWNGKVDIDFKLDSKPTEPYQMQVEVYDNVGKTNLPVKSVCTEGISFEENPTMVREDTRRIIWDAAKDLPNGFKCTNVLVSCRDSRVGAESNRYMIVDLSAGASADAYQVSYTNEAPAGGWTEEHMTTKLVLRKIPSGSFVMGSAVGDPEHESNESKHKVTLTKSYYISIYELTASQGSKIDDSIQSGFAPIELDWYAIRGNDMTPNLKRENWYAYNGGAGHTIHYNGQPNEYTWPYTNGVDATSLIGKLRDRTGIMFDLPTEAQWERACRAGTETQTYLGESNSVAVTTRIKGEPVYDVTHDHLLYVGQHTPNAYGLYDMQGNVAEWCLDVYTNDLGQADVVDPKGPCCAPNLEVVQDKGYHDGYEYVGYSGYERVKRGSGNRSAGRSSEKTFNLVNSGYAMMDPSDSSKAYVNPTAGVRLVVIIDE